MKGAATFAVLLVLFGAMWTTVVAVGPTSAARSARGMIAPRAHTKV